MPAPHAASSGSPVTSTLANQMKTLFTIAVVFMIAFMKADAQTGPQIGNSPVHIEYKNGIPISAKGFPPYTEIKEPYSKRLFVVQPDGELKPEADLPHIEGTLTLRGKKLVFISTNTTDEYEASHAPNITVLAYSQRTVAKKSGDTIAAKMIIEIYDRVKLTLLEGVPIPVIKIADGDYGQWKSKKD